MFIFATSKSWPSNIRLKQINCLLKLTFTLIITPIFAASTLPTQEITDVFHGVTVHDPYRYLEDTKNPQVQSWLKEQAETTRQTLDQIPIRAQLEKRIEEFSQAGGDVIRNIVRMPGNRIYYLKRSKGAKQFQLIMRKNLRAKEEVLVDPEVETQQTGIPHAINYFMPSWDGKYMAYGLSAGGSENASLYILNIKDQKVIGQPIPRVHQDLVNWLPDSKSLTFNQFRDLPPGSPETETFLDSSVLWLRVGDPITKAKSVFGPTINRDLGLARLDVGQIIFSPSSPWMIARTTDTTLPEGFLFVAPTKDLGNPNITWKKIATAADKITQVALRGNHLYVLTHADTPRNRVLELDLQNPKLTLAREVAKAPPDMVLERFSLTRRALIGEIRENTSITLRRYSEKNFDGQAIPLPFPGAANIEADPAHVYEDVLYTLSGWTELPRTFLLRGTSSLNSGLTPNLALANLPEITISEAQVTSHDGVKIPLTLLHKKNIIRDGNNPTLLMGYGAYGFSETAWFRPDNMAWLEQGGILAFANVRGSGAYGKNWYQAGYKTTKPNTWKDGVACAQYLIREGYTSPKTLGIMGTSAGGIFVGRSVTTAPELFAAAIFNVGMLDIIRAEESANGITNISEFGSVKNPEEFPALLEMSTYHQIKDNTEYPAVMLIHGMNDPRVDVWHSAKTTARLQAASRGTKPILLRLDLQAGHGVGSTATQRNALSADIYGFLLWQMGKAPNLPKDTFKNR